MSKKIQLTEQEVSSIRGLYPLANKKVLNEQSVYEKIKKSYSEPCSGSNEIKEPVVNVKVVYDKNNIPIRANFTLKGYFGATKSANKVYNEALLQMKEKIFAELSSKQVIGNYDLGLVFIKKVIGSASNFLNGPLLPTHSLYGKPISPQALAREPYNNLPKEGDSNWNKNKGYADSRWENMVSFIKNNGNSIGFSVGTELKNPKTIESRITDTGGCTDEKRDINNFPNPGQYVLIEGVMKLTPKPLDDDDIELLTECAEGLKIIVGYFAQSMKAMDTNIRMPQNSSTHNCDYATFTISCNGIPVGISNMNNGKQRNRNKLAMVGLSQENVRRRAPKQEGDTVYSLISVGSDQLRKIIQNSKNGRVDMRIEGTRGSLRRPKSDGYHADAPMVCAYVEDTDGSKRIVYGPKEPFGKSARDVGQGVSKPMGSFNPCITVKEV
jgi:hypothetical protein